MLETFSPYTWREMCWDLKQMSRKLQSSENDSYCIADPKQIVHEKQQTAMSSTESGSIQTLTSAVKLDFINDPCLLCFVCFTYKPVYIFIFFGTTVCKYPKIIQGNPLGAWHNNR